MSIENSQFGYNSTAENPPQNGSLEVEQTRRRMIETLEGRIDQFLDNPPKQPKREIADLGRSDGDNTCIGVQRKAGRKRAAG